MWKIPCSCEEEAHLGSDFGDMAVMEVEQRRRSDAAPGRFSRRLNGIVECAIVEKVYEPVTHRDAAPGQLSFPQRLNEPVHAMKPVKVFFSIGEVHTERARA